MLSKATLTVNQKLFYFHVVIRDFFYSVNHLGWVFLFLAGMPIVKVFFGWLLFRVIESFVFMPLSFHILKRVSWKKMMMLALVLQALMAVLFFYSPRSDPAYGFMIIVFSITDVTYWPIRNNLERNTVSPKKNPPKCRFFRRLFRIRQNPWTNLGSHWLKLSGPGCFYNFRGRITVLFPAVCFCELKNAPEAF